MTTPSLRLDGTQIYLRTLAPADATDRYVAWLNDPVVNEFLETRAADIPKIVAYIEEKNLRDDCLFMGIFWKETNTHIGNIKLEPIDRENKTATIGILIGEKDFWNRGVASEAIQLVKSYAFEQLGLVSLTLGVVSIHAAAIRAYEKNGFKKIRTDVAALRHGDQYFDRVWMELKK